MQVTWYVLENKDGEEEGRCFTYSEMELFQKFALSHPDNFAPNSQDYQSCTEEELAPDCGSYFSVPNPNATCPTNIILRKKPQILTQGNITKCMDIILCNGSGTDNHKYDLDFDVVGVIET